MKQKKTRKLLTLIIVTMMTVLLLGTVVSAADKYDPPASGDATTAKFTKYLVVPNDTNIPALTFTYSIAAGAAAAGNANNLPVYAGDDTARVTGSPSVGDAVFTANQTTTAGVADDGIANDTDHRYASTDVAIDFSGVTFSEPGVYRYIITENTTTPSNVTYETENTRTLDVNVIDNNGTLEVASYVMYYGTLTDPQSKTTVQDTTATKPSQKAGIEKGDKCNSFVNKFPSQGIYVGKKIIGNQASKDKYFRFEIKLTRAGAGTVINVAGDYTTSAISSDVNGATTIEAADLTGGATTYTNPDKITTLSDGSATAVFYLQGGQYVQLQGVPTGANYDVEEMNYSTDGYEQAATSASNKFTIGSLEFKDATSGAIAQGVDIKTGYINTKNGVIPTGVIISAAGLLVVGIIAVIGFVFFGTRSRRRYEDD
ncbi:pilin isopeptide linkage domain-containing protein [Lachnospiraceae bacterium NE2001]|nr:pilin isopeptide linkage domain-containing protein [Lachnospiraceae bacterium NE2001]